MNSTLEQKHSTADNILIARISGCDPDKLSEDGYCSRHGWTLDPIEDLKGSNARVRVLPSDTELAINTCDVSLKVGETYLLFLREGRAHLCSGTLNLSRNEAGGELGTPEIGARQVEVLRAYRDGAIKHVTDPWYFFDREWSCAIEHPLDGVTMLIGYQLAWPPGAQPPNTGPITEPVVGLSLWPMPMDDFVGATLLEVDGQPVPLTRHASTWPDMTAFHVEEVHGEAAVALLDKMRRPVDVVFSGTRSRNGGAAELFRLATHTALFGEAAARLEACRATRAKQDSNRK